MPVFHVSETIVIAAPLAKVRATILDAKQWGPWSPWVVAEPDCAMTYDTDGASYGWEGKIMGSGRMELAAQRDDGLDYNLTFLKPFKSHNKSSFHFETVPEGTRVTWRMEGSLPFFMFFLKKMLAAFVGADFRRGLARMKDYIEAGSVPSKLAFAGVGEGLRTPYIGITARSPIAAIGPAISAQFESLATWMKAHDVAAAGAPLTIYHKFHIVAQETDYTAAIPVASVPASLPPEFTSGTLDVPRSYKIVHTGVYRHLASAWAAAMMHQNAKQFRPNKGLPGFERYLTDPSAVADAAAVVEVHLPAV
ncbi:MAG: SRPBCC family protein [Myxococcales bacterium]|nr:SRPBCC family protein [Myxococcales bacterium]